MTEEVYIACICEGAAEEAIIDILLDNDKLIFSRKDMIEEDPIRCRGAKNFEREYLNKSFSKKIRIYRILDSKRENSSLVMHIKIKLRSLTSSPLPKLRCSLLSVKINIMSIKSRKSQAYTV